MTPVTPDIHSTPHGINDLTPLLSALPPERRWRGQLFPAPAAVGLIREQSGSDRLLLIHRKGEPYAGQWALVGGKWDFGESLAEAACREALEESGLHTRFVALRAVVSERVLPPDTAGSAAHFLLLICDLVVEDGEAAEQDEGRVAWFRPDEMAALAAAGQMIPSDYAIVRAFGGNETQAPLAEVVMRAPIENATAPPLMLSFEQIGRSG